MEQKQNIASQIKFGIRITLFVGLFIGEVYCLFFISTLVSSWETETSHKIRRHIRIKRTGMAPHEEETIMNGVYSTYMASLGVLGIYSLLFTAAYTVNLARGIPKIGPALEELLEDKSARPAC